MAEHHPPPNWVKKRADCDLDLIFKMLRQIIERDVAEMNKLPEFQRHGCKFKLDEGQQGTHPILWVKKFVPNGDLPESVSFEQGQDFIRTHAGCIHAEWDDRKGTCELVMGDKRYEPWQVSQLVLSPLFFGS